MLNVLLSSMLVYALMAAVPQSAEVRTFRTLKSNDWQVRAAGVQQLIENPSLLKTPTAKIALVALLDQETKRVSDPNSNEANKGGEDYAEYYGHLLDVVDSLVDSSDATAVSVLVRSIYNPDSKFALKLASYGQTIVAPLLQLSIGSHAHDRAIAAEMLGRVLREQRLGSSRQPLSSRSARDVESRLRSQLHDSQGLVRRAAIRGVVAAGDLESIGTLEQLRQSDPYSRTLPDGSTKFLVRDDAAKAIAAIHANPLAQR
jgi:hypothetical protein